MVNRLLMVVGLAVLCGIVAGLVWGRLVGAGLGTAMALIGAIIVVLVRNQKDLHELEHGHVPEEVDRALGNAPPPP